MNARLQRTHTFGERFARHSRAKMPTALALAIGSLSLGLAQTIGTGDPRSLVFAGLFGVFLAVGWVLGVAVRASSLRLSHGLGVFACAALATFVVLALPATTLAQEAAAAPQPAAQEGRNDDYCGRRLGQWFYCIRPEPPKRPERKADAAPTPDTASRPPEVVELEAFQKQLSEALQVATWNPTTENVEKYFLLQRTALDKGGVFADVWRRMVWNKPELDYTLKYPVAEVSKHNWLDERRFNRDIFLRGFSAELGLFYVYRSTCGACEIFNPIIRGFADRFGLNVKPISTDGTRNPHFAETLQDSGQLAAWGIDRKVTPAILVYQRSSIDPKTGKVRQLAIRGASGKELRLRPCTRPKGCMTYVGAGVIPVDDMAERLFVMLATEPGGEL